MKIILRNKLNTMVSFSNGEEIPEPVTHYHTTFEGNKNGSPSICTPPWHNDSYGLIQKKGGKFLLRHPGLFLWLPNKVVDAILTPATNEFGEVSL